MKYECTLFGTIKQFYIITPSMNDKAIKLRTSEIHTDWVKVSVVCMVCVEFPLMLIIPFTGAVHS